MAATTHTVFTATVVDGDFREYAVSTRRGSVRITHGRVMGTARTGWTALGIGAKAWTTQYPTRAAAVAAMFAGVTWLDLRAARELRESQAA